MDPRPAIGSRSRERDKEQREVFALGRMHAASILSSAIVTPFKPSLTNFENCGGTSPKDWVPT
jgi:hypothetical protein